MPLGFESTATGTFSPEESARAQQILKELRAKRSSSTIKTSEPDVTREQFNQMLADRKARDQMAEQARNPKPETLLSKAGRLAGSAYSGLAGLVKPVIESAAHTATGIASPSPVLKAVSPLIPEEADLPILGKTSLKTHSPLEDIGKGGEAQVAGMKKTAGQSLSDFANAYGGEGVESIKAGAKLGTAITGAVSGGAGNAGAALQDPKNSLSEVAAQGVRGAGIGGVLGGALGTAGAALKYAKQVYEPLERVLNTAEDQIGNLTKKQRQTWYENKIAQVENAGKKMDLTEVISTPAEDVHKLGAEERAAWFRHKEDLVKQEHKAGLAVEDQKMAEFSNQIKTQEQQFGKIAEAKKQGINVRSEAEIMELEQQSQKLTDQLKSATNEKVLELRPKILNMMRRQSAKYQELVEQGMAGKENMVVDKQMLKDFIDTRFADDLKQSGKMKEILGLTEQVDPMSTGKVGVNLRQTKTTLGGIYEQTKALKQERGNSVSGVYTSEEKDIDDAINTLSSFMKKNGVDLGPANKFWSKYAETRNELVKQSKLFSQNEYTTGKLAKTIQSAAAGKDVNNVKFIKEVENLLGEPVTEEARSIFSKMDMNDKKMIVSRIQAEEDKIAAEAEHAMAANELKQRETGMQDLTNTIKGQKGILFEQNRSELSQKHFSADAKARNLKEEQVLRLKKLKDAADRKTILGEAAKTVIGAYISNKILKETTGLGFNL